MDLTMLMSFIMVLSDKNGKAARFRLQSATKFLKKNSARFGDTRILDEVSTFQ